MSSEMPICRLCGARNNIELITSHHQCLNCAYVFKALHLMPKKADEHARYRSHENNPNDPEYINFLRTLTDPLIPFLKSGMKGLDYGCGDGSPVTSLLSPVGVEVDEYDPLFRPNSSVLKNRYDVIVASEVVEHLHAPARDFKRLHERLNPFGLLAIRTNFVPVECYGDWWYHRDPTHVGFYSNPVFKWIASTWNMTIEYLADPVAILRRSG